MLKKSLKIVLLLILAPVVLLAGYIVYLAVKPYELTNDYRRLADFKSPDAKQTASLYVNWDTSDNKHHYLLVLPGNSESRTKILMSAYYEGEDPGEKGCGGQLYWADEEKASFPIQWIGNTHIKVPRHLISINDPVFECE